MPSLPPAHTRWNRAEPTLAGRWPRGPECLFRPAWRVGGVLPLNPPLL